MCLGQTHFEAYVVVTVSVFWYSRLCFLHIPPFHPCSGHVCYCWFHTPASNTSVNSNKSRQHGAYAPAATMNGVDEDSVNIEFISDHGKNLPHKKP